MNSINDTMVAATMRGYDRNNLFAFVATVIGSDEATRLMNMYRGAHQSIGKVPRYSGKSQMTVKSVAVRLCCMTD